MIERSVPCPGPHGVHRMTYYDWGAADEKRIVICVHGLTRNGRDFDALAQALAAHFRVICPDVVGRGRSDWLAHKEDYNYPRYLSDMSALIASVGAREIYWVGTSMGGLIGMLLAMQPNTPIARLVMNDVGPFIPRYALERIATYVGKAPRCATLEEFEQYLRVVSQPFGPLTDQQWRHLAVHSCRLGADGRYGACYDPGIAAALAGITQDVSLWPMWDAVRCPTLVLRGADSDLLLADTAQEMTRRGPRPAIVEFAGVGHAPMLMAAEQIEVVRAFLLAA